MQTAAPEQHLAVSAASEGPSLSMLHLSTRKSVLRLVTSTAAVDEHRGQDPGTHLAMKPRFVRPPSHCAHQMRVRSAL